MLKFEDLMIGDQIREYHPKGFEIDSIVDEEPAFVDGNWIITTIAPSNEFLEYRQDKEGKFYNHHDIEIDIKLVFMFNKR